MKKTAMIIFVLFSTVVFNSFPVVASNELAKMAVVIDAGHGGMDPGANRPFPNNKKALVTESAYCYDVALRLERMLKSKGALVIKTTKNDSWKAPIANQPNASK
jgi:N-acetylmuramoyl-L-alanine amidase